MSRHTIANDTRANDTADDEIVLSVRNLSVEFATGNGYTRVVDDVSFSLRPRETMGIVGESGSGKSVTSMSIMRLIPTPPGRIANGEIVFAGQDLLQLSELEMRRIRGDRISMIFQEPLTALNPAYTIGNQLVEAIRTHREITRKQATERAAELLDLVGIPSPRQRLLDYPHQFSGGMLQRAMIAGALACDPELLIADEPTTALDVTIQAQILELLRRVQEEFGMSMLFISHDLGVIADVCDRVGVMYAGQLVESSDVFELFARPFHPYTEGLLRAMPQHTAGSEELVPIPGTTPDLASVEAQCRFEPRCRHAVAGCGETVVPLETVGAREVRCLRAHHLELEGAS
ncbi:ABC transporter ATP-binding protein [Pseudonocardia halophobica]|uniref:ABC transporter ATP-binding protein n=1 Tax=Pseudonocardia halophobica TaxID=29401 RepID=A0A9W6L053_9PSEU|nr:ABC transporter ATP-binding protein [Pseudonocardia halophobica]GLL10578.1 ABC transporter ATP-binding protein [Pseudonocardia halophobica]